MAPLCKPLPQRPNWVERQRRRRRSALLRLLDHSFGLRLLLALIAATAALAGVNRFEQCRNQHFAAGCVWQDAGGVMSVGNLEALSIMTAAFLYILEGSKRRQREHHEAYEMFLTCQQAGVRFAPARNDALELLSGAGLDLSGWNLSAIDLEGIQVPGARWQGVNLSGSSLREANLRGADLREADLRGADLRGADLSQADLSGALLEGASLEGAVLEGCLLDPPATADRS